MKKAALITAAALAAAGAAGAQSDTDPAQAAPAPCAGDVYRAFDFWEGEWDVFDPQGAKAGGNSITTEENGCLLVERWRGSGGTTGQSYNFYDPGLAKWRQLWVSPGATIDYAGGLDAGGAMALEGEIAYRNGTTFPFKGTWTLQEDGAVIQHFQQFNPETDEWDDWFIGRYVKKSSAD